MIAMTQSACIILMPCNMNPKPNPSTIPTTTDAGTSRATRAINPLKPSRSQITPVASAALYTAAGVTNAVCTAWIDATAPMAFMGCTGNGVL